MRKLLLAAPLVLAGCIDTCSEAKIYEAVQEAVLGELRLPSTAVFPPRDSITMTRSGSVCSFGVNGFVEAQNSAGNPTRIEYEALALRNTEGVYRAVVSSVSQR